MTMRSNGLIMALVSVVGISAVGSPGAAYWFKHCSQELHWNSDVERVADLHPGPADTVTDLFGIGPREEHMGVYQGTLFFQGDDGKSGAELWRMNGGVPVRVADLAPGPASSSPHSFIVFEGALYFAATTPGTGEELFRYANGSVSLAAETVPGSKGGGIYAPIVFQKALYFARKSNQDGPQVWRFDGTDAAPVAVMNGMPGRVETGAVGGERTMAVFGGQLYHVRSTPLPEHYELWRFDGASMRKVKALTHGDEITSYSFGLGVYQNALYFGVVAPGPNTWQKVDELWRYTGTGVPSKLASLGDAWSYSQPRDFETLHGKLYFTAQSDLYRYDGSTVESLGSTTSSLPSWPKNLTRHSGGGRIVLSGRRPATGVEPYVFDGAAAQLLADIDSSMGSSAGSWPSYAAVADGLYFFAEDEAHGRELWVDRGQAIPVLECHVVVTTIWDDWLEWPIDEREVLIGTWWITEQGASRLISRVTVTVRPDEAVTLRVLELDTRRSGPPEGFALATVVIDRKSGRVLERGFDVVGRLGARERVRVSNEASRLLGTASPRSLAREEVRSVER
jgi:ELWxxDGT repeat protein